jgi:hypothetical protein
MHGDHPAPAKLNDDMIPAINRKAADANAPRTLDLSQRKLKARPAAPIEVPAAILTAAQRAEDGPDILVNPNPSPTPSVLEPGK